MTSLPKAALLPFLTSLADDEFVLGHRDSEWCAFAPMIEEDVAFASIAQDEMGHARLYYTLAQKLGAPPPDLQAFEREAGGFRSAVLLERPNGDWAYTVARHLVYDTYDDLLTQALSSTPFEDLRDIVRLVRREERYHLEHQVMWAGHLAAGTEESRRRLEAALSAVFSEAGGLFETEAWHAELLAAGILSAEPRTLLGPFLEQMGDVLGPYGLALPPLPPEGGNGGRGGRHTKDLEQCVATLSEVYRLDPQASW